MAQKKITVLGDAGDPSLTPEEEQKIEVKVDEMLALDDQAPKQLLKHKTITPLEPSSEAEPTQTEAEAETAEAEPAAEPESGPTGAPPLDKKLAKKITIIDKNAEDETDAPAEPEMEELTPAALPSTPLKITVSDPELEIVDAKDPEPAAGDEAEFEIIDEPEVEAEADTEAEPQESETAAEPEDQAAAEDEFGPMEPFEPAEPENKSETEPESETEVEQDTEPETPSAPALPTTKPASTAPADDGGGKKYRPPDGPMPFKRAPSVEDVQAPEAAAAANLSSEEQEDAAIAEAFATKDAPATHKVRKPVRRKTVLLVVILAVVVLAASAFAIPSVRQRIVKPAHKASTATTSSTTTPKATTAPVASPAPAAPVPEIFLAKTSGIYNLYKSDQTGQNKQLLLAGSGYETSPTTQMVANASGSLAALVSLRDGTKDDAGYPIQTLTLVDTSAATKTMIGQSQRFQILGWYGSKLVYVMSKTGAAAATDPNSYQLLSYDTATKQKQTLDHAAHFNAVLTVHDYIYYATDGTSGALYRLKADGSGKQTVLNKLVSSVYRTDYNALAIATAGSWYTLDVSTANSKPVSTVNAYNGTNKLYIDAPDGKTSLHLETQNGAPALLLYTVATKKDTVLSQKAGLSYPLHWLTATTAAFRIDTDTETADYTVNISTGAITKLIDTSSFTGLEP